jgi:RNA polymerase sigma-70 factor, ECF subfamily
MNENLAIQEIGQQNPHALEYLMDQHGVLVLRLIRQILGSDHPGDIEECANDVWMTVWQKARQYKSEKSCVKTWICMIARCKSIDRLRKICSSTNSTWSLDDERMPELQAEMMELPEMLEDREESRSRAAFLTKALSQMASAERNILIRRYYYFEDIADLALSLGISRAAMDNRLSRARKLLCRYYVEAHDEAIHK